MHSKGKNTQILKALKNSTLKNFKESRSRGLKAAVIESIFGP